MNRTLTKPILVLAFGVLTSFGMAACDSEVQPTAAPDDFQLSDEVLAELSATAAAFQVESVARMEDSGTPIDPPTALPEFDLIDHSGAPFGSNDLAGKQVLLSFAYTHCPDVCPALFGHLIAVQREIPGRIGDDVEMVIITVDPERDTPEQLAERTAAMGGQWHFLTGSREVLEEVWSDFGVRVEKQGEFVGHTGVTYLVSADGLMLTRYPAYATFEHFLKGIEALASGS